MPNDKKKTAQQERELKNSQAKPKPPAAGQSGAQAGNDAMDQKPGAPGDHDAPPDGDED